MPGGRPRVFDYLSKFLGRLSFKCTFMKTTKSDLISIVMPVYNAGKFLRQALTSIRNQTHQNWELLAVDDFSRDDSLSILKQFKKLDSRIKIFRNKKNLGVAATANFAISKAKSRMIARMDADDIMYSTRLADQLKTLKEHPSVVVLGSQCDLIDAEGNKFGKKLFPTCPKDIFNMLFWACPVQQPSIMVNAHLVPSYFRWYIDGAKTGEEINFLIRISKYGSIVNSKKTYLKYRIHNTNLSLNQNQKNVFFDLFKKRLAAVINKTYKPSVKSIAIGLVEAFVVALIPTRAILPLFQIVRGMKDLHLKLNLPLFPNLRTVHMSA